jgi:hypothetical protein
MFSMKRATASMSGTVRFKALSGIVARGLAVWSPTRSGVSMAGSPCLELFSGKRLILLSPLRDSAHCFGGLAQIAAGGFSSPTGRVTSPCQS